MDAPINVWNEVRFTSDGISVSLFSESSSGPAILEDELSLTFDEMSEMAPAEPLPLNLSEETQQSLSDQREDANIGRILQSENLSEKADEMPENPTSTELLAYMGFIDDRHEEQVEVGDVVRDARPPHWAVENKLEVVNIPDKSASEYVVQERVFEDSDTVADANPSAEPDETVIEAKYLDQSDESKTYAFPISRIEEI